MVGRPVLLAAVPSKEAVDQEPPGGDSNSTAECCDSNSTAECCGLQMGRLLPSPPGPWVRRALLKRLPILGWLPGYSVRMLAGDLVAGVSVGLLTVPQGLAYGVVAGLPPNYGLYSAFIGSFVYLLLGTTPHLCVGPTAIMALLTRHYASNGGADYAVLLCFVTGCIQLLAALVNLSFLVNFISLPVISGFCSAAAVTIMSSQVKALLGLKLRTHGVLDTWLQVFRNITDTRWQDCLLGLTCIASLIFLKNIKHLYEAFNHKRNTAAAFPESYQKKVSFTAKPGDEENWEQEQEDKQNANYLHQKEEEEEVNQQDEVNEQGKDSSRQQNWFTQVLFTLTVSRNALAVVFSAIIAYTLQDSNTFSLTGYVKPGLPGFSLPPFNPTINNQTMSFMDVMRDVGVGVVVLPFISILDDIAIIQSIYPSRTIDAGQEIAALGIINILGSFCKSMPTTASLSRTLVNRSSGGGSPAASVVSGLMVLLALAVLTPAFRWIPQSSLSAVIMCAVVRMIDARLVVTLWRASKKDLLVLLTTFITCLVWSIEWGVLAGALLNILMVLFWIARPKTTVTTTTTRAGEAVVVARPHRGLLYPGTVRMRAAVERAGRKQAAGRQQTTGLHAGSGEEAENREEGGDKGEVNVRKEATRWEETNNINEVRNREVGQKYYCRKSTGKSTAARGTEQICNSYEEQHRQTHTHKTKISQALTRKQRTTSGNEDATNEVREMDAVTGRKKIVRKDSLPPLILDCCALQTIDYTAAKGLINLAKDFHDRHQLLIFVNMVPGIEKVVSASRVSSDADLPIFIVPTTSTDHMVDVHDVQDVNYLLRACSTGCKPSCVPRYRPPQRIASQNFAGHDGLLTCRLEDSSPGDVTISVIEETGKEVQLEKSQRGSPTFERVDQHMGQFETRSSCRRERKSTATESTVIVDKNRQEDVRIMLYLNPVTVFNYGTR